MKKYQEIKDELIERLDKASYDIKEAEEVLRSIPASRNASFTNISWDSERQRIMKGGRPLIENKAEDRLDAVPYLRYLINQVLLDSEEFLAKHPEAK